MSKLNLATLSLLLLAVFPSTDVFAQRGSQQRSGNQSANRNSIQRANGQQRGQKGQAGQGNRNGSQRNRGNSGNALTANEKQGLILMREEEKLARDVYTAMNAKWNDQIFANISRAESQHMSAVGSLLSRYGISDPIQNNAAGVFTAPQFQKLYTTLVASGSKSLEDALKVGLKIEEMDIADLRLAIQSTNNQDIRRVLENLLRASRNHLRAFASRLNGVGGTYIASNLPQADFNRIASSQRETGRGNGQQSERGNRQNGQGQKGKGRGNGQGRGNRKNQ